jgi:hypothetical protein
MGARVPSEVKRGEYVAMLQTVGHWELPSVARNRRAEVGCSFFFSFLFIFFCDYDSRE